MILETASYLLGKSNAFVDEFIYQIHLRVFPLRKRKSNKKLNAIILIMTDNKIYGRKIKILISMQMLTVMKDLQGSEKSNLNILVFGLKLFEGVLT